MEAGPRSATAGKMNNTIVHATHFFHTQELFIERVSVGCVTAMEELAACVSGKPLCHLRSAVQQSPVGAHHVSLIAQ